MPRRGSRTQQVASSGQRRDPGPRRDPGGPWGDQVGGAGSQSRWQPGAVPSRKASAAELRSMGTSARGVIWPAWRSLARPRRGPGPREQPQRQPAPCHKLPAQPGAEDSFLCPRPRGWTFGESVLLPTPGGQQVGSWTPKRASSFPCPSFSARSPKHALSGRGLKFQYGHPGGV